MGIPSLTGIFVDDNIRIIGYIRKYNFSPIDTGK